MYMTARIIKFLSKGRHIIDQTFSVECPRITYQFIKFLIFISNQFHDLFAKNVSSLDLAIEKKCLVHGDIMNKLARNDVAVSMLNAVKEILYLDTHGIFKRLYI